MKLYIFAVYDVKTSSYGNPMFLQSEGSAIRSFSDEVNRSDDQNMLFKHSEDFGLYALGSFETDTGDFETGKPRQVVLGSQVKATRQ